MATDLSRGSGKGKSPTGIYRCHDFITGGKMLNIIMATGEQGARRGGGVR